MTVRVLAGELRTPSVSAAAPASVRQLRERVEQTPGVRLGALLDALQPDPDAQQAALDHLLHTARAMPDEQDELVERHLQQWEPLLAGIVAATDGDPTAGEQVQQALDERAGSQDWAALVVVLRRVLTGDRDPSELLDGLDALAGRVQLNPAPPVAGDQPPQKLSSAGFDGQHQATEVQAWRHHGSTRMSFGSERSAW